MNGGDDREVLGVWIDLTLRDADTADELAADLADDDRVRGAHVVVVPEADAEHRPMCRVCRTPWPCRHRRIDIEAARFAYELSRLCHHCGQPIRNGQRSTMFGGPCLDNPEIVGPRFHVAASRYPACAAAASAYGRRWRNRHRTP